MEKYSPSTSPNFYELYWYGAGNEALDETDGTGSTTDSAFHEYVMFGGRRIARRDSSGNVEYYLDDQLGSARVVTNATGGILDDIDYCPYGSECYVASQTSGNNYKFTGKERDAESGLDYFTARYDASFLARFTSPDPHNAGAQAGDPQTWNAYSYVRDSPLILTDPTGLCTNGMDDAGGACQNVGQGERTNANVADICGRTPRCYQTSDSAQNTVTVEQVQGQGANIADHAAISVNGQQAVGLEQKKDSPTAAVEDKTTPGAVKPVDPNRTVKDKAVIPVSPEQAAKIQKFLDNAKTSPPNYNLYHSNCAQFCESALKAGGVKNVPNDVTPRGLVHDLNGSPSFVEYNRMVPFPIF